MLDARFSHLYFCQNLYTLQRGLAAIAGLLVFDYVVSFKFSTAVKLAGHFETAQRLLRVISLADRVLVVHR